MRRLQEPSDYAGKSLRETQQGRYCYHFSLRVALPPAESWQIVWMYADGHAVLPNGDLVITRATDTPQEQVAALLSAGEWRDLHREDVG